MKNRTIGYLCNGKRCDYCESRMHPGEKHNCRHTTDKKYAKYRFRLLRKYNKIDDHMWMEVER